jgi:succinyl-CoA synthetase beta subunit
VVIKILSSSITHKSDVGGVAVNVAAHDALACVARMTNDVQAHTGERPERFLIQEMVAGGVEVILGFRRDALGGAVLLGMGGVMAELIQDTTLRLLPANGGGFSTQAAREMVGRLKMFPLLDGYRGRARADVDALVQAIVDFSWMAAQLGTRLTEAEINPLFVLPHGQGVRAADGVAVLTA